MCLRSLLIRGFHIVTLTLNSSRLVQWIKVILVGCRGNGGLMFKTPVVGAFLGHYTTDLIPILSLTLTTIFVFCEPN